MTILPSSLYTGLPPLCLGLLQSPLPCGPQAANTRLFDGGGILFHPCIYLSRRHVGPFTINEESAGIGAIRIEAYSMPPLHVTRPGPALALLHQGCNS